MNFAIQTGNPIANYSKLKEYTFKDAAENIFILNTENAIMYWNGICIPLDYKYTIGDILNSILEMLESLLDNDEGDKRILFFESNFLTTWQLSWNKNQLTIISYWNSVPNAKVIVDILEKNNKIIIDKSLFIAEWKVLLITFKNNLLKFYAHAKEVEGFDKLESIEQRIKHKGCLYIQ